MGIVRGVEKLPGRHEPYEVVSGDVVANVDVCVIGSGAGGAVMTRELAAGGRSVALLERGGYYEGRDMNQRDEDMVPILWKNAGLNFDDDLSIAIAQGACLGGSTVINDAVCFDPPARVRAEWRDRGVNFTDQEWAVHTERVRQTIHVAQVTEAELNRNNRMLREGARKIGLREHYANHRNCVNCMQCGFCHNGCHYETKQNMLVTYLHLALHDPSGDVQVYCNCSADTLRVNDGRVVGVEGRFLDVAGKERGRIRVNARAVVVAAGAIASSYLLLKNRIASRTAGRGVCLHPSVLMVGQFPYEVKPNQGIPMAYAVHDFGVNRTQEKTREEYGAQGGEFLIESISLPMLELAAGLPGNFRAHHAFLRKFNNLAIAGMLARDSNLGRVSLTPENRLSFVYKPGPRELAMLAKASEVTGKMFFALGAERIATRHPAIPFVNSPEELPRLSQAMLQEPGRMKLASAHPQSGNPIGPDPTTSVVDPDCRVHGFSNLFVADASVFPNAVGVNPQVTVMVVASIAAARMLKDWDHRYAPLPLSTGTGATGTPSRPMHLTREALARLFTETRSTRGPEALLTPVEEAPTDQTWSFDAATGEITNDTRWRGFLARDEAPAEKNPLYGKPFWRRFTGSKDAVKGVTHPVGTDLFASTRAAPAQIPSLGECVAIEYVDAPHSRSSEVLKVLDDRVILGRAFDGKPGVGDPVVDFSLVRKYPLTFMTADDHRMLFQRSAAPAPEAVLGIWEGQLVGEGGWSVPLIRFRFHLEAAILSTDYRFGSSVIGTAPVTAAKDQLEILEASRGSRDELRWVNDEWMLGIHYSSPETLAGWLPADSGWYTTGAGGAVGPVQIRYALRRVAEPGAYRE